MAWDKTLIAEGVLAPDLNDEIRSNWEALEDALGKEMNFSTGGTASLQGILKQGGAVRAFFQDTAPATRLDGSAFASTDLGMLWFDSNTTIDNQFNVLTATTPTWTPISTEIIAVAVAAAHTWADVQTFTLAAVFTLPPTFTAGVAANDTYLTATDAAGTGTVDLIKADGSDVPTVPDDTANATSGAPTADASLANKKYVDDQIAASVTLSAFATDDSDTNTMLKSTVAAPHAYKAQTDGYVTANASLSTNGDAISLYISTSADAAGSPNVTIQNETDGGGSFKSVGCFVPKNSYFEITLKTTPGGVDTADTPTITWISMGTLSKPVDND